MRLSLDHPRRLALALSPACFLLLIAGCQSRSANAVEKLGGSGAEVLAAAAQLNSTVTEQSTSLVETTTTMEEVRNTAGLPPDALRQHHVDIRGRAEPMVVHAAWLTGT